MSHSARVLVFFVLVSVSASCGPRVVLGFYKEPYEPVQSWEVNHQVELANKSGSPEMLEYLLKLQKKYKKKYKW